LTEIDQRTLQDRRKQPTPGLSRYSFFGRRRMFRRKSDEAKGGYIDRYSSTLFFFVILILGLNVLDVLLTVMILDLKGWELNPIARSVIDIHGDKFWIWKFGIVSVSLVLLCLHSKFKPVRAVIVALSSIYVLVVIYQIFLLLYL
jgi:hypothetical protein